MKSAVPLAVYSTASLCTVAIGGKVPINDRHTISKNIFKVNKIFDKFCEQKNDSFRQITTQQKEKICYNK